MDFVVMFSSLLAIVATDLATSVVAAKAPQLHSDIVYDIRSHRSSDEMQDKMFKSRGSKDVSSPINFNGHEQSSDKDNTVVEESQPVVDHTGPVHLTTESSPFFHSHHSKYYVNNPYQYDSNTQIDNTNDQRLEHSSNYVNMVPNWNRYYPGHRHYLNKYGVRAIMGTDTMSVQDSGGHGHVLSYSDADYDSEINNNVNHNYYEAVGTSYTNPKIGIEHGSGWYGESKKQSPRPAAEASGRQPYLFTIDVHKLAFLAIIKLGLAKLKAFKVLKLLLLLAIKLKLLALFKIFMIAKFWALRRLLRLLLLPYLYTLWSWLMNAAQTNMNATTSANMQNAMQNAMENMLEESVNASSSFSGSASNDFRAGSIPARNGADFSFNGAKFVPKLAQLLATVRSAQCVQRTACRAAAGSNRSSAISDSTWINGILSSLVDYISNKKLKSYVSTFKEVSNHRLENIFSNPSREEWSKWCDERYSCEEEPTIDDNLI